MATASPDELFRTEKVAQISARFCTVCGEPFEIPAKIMPRASQDKLFRTKKVAEKKRVFPIIDTLDVDRFFSSRHKSKYKPLPSLLVTYNVIGHLIPFK